MLARLTRLLLFSHWFLYSHNISLMFYLFFKFFLYSVFHLVLPLVLPLNLVRQLIMLVNI